MFNNPNSISGVATWYKPGDNHTPGTLTASGTEYSTTEAQCAFYVDPKNKREFLGKYITITNLITLKSIKVKVVDNGNYHTIKKDDAKLTKGFVICDLNEFAKNKLSFGKRGYIEVEITY